MQKQALTLEVKQAFRDHIDNRLSKRSNKSNASNPNSLNSSERDKPDRLPKKETYKR